MLINAIIGHLVGDFLLQNDYMALRKKQSSWICGMHCAIWTTMVMVFADWPFWCIFPLFLTHFFQDRTDFIRWYMRKIGQNSFMEPPLGPWSVIIVDQVWHLLVLWALSVYVGNS